MTMHAAEIIRKKRDAEELSAEEIRWFIRGAESGHVADYQVSAFLMAVFFRGMSAAETAELTRQMLLSGTVLTWPENDGPYVDKHSTGGIGDKVSLVLAPLLACCGVHVPMSSGRGLGATGGTLDKLESIPGYRTDLSIDELQRVCRQVGCVITGASAQLAPADKRLYALRDVTATVASIPLITASILSKKLAAGLQALVMDIKWGSGAFMKNFDDARKLAKSIVDVGAQMGLKTAALLTDMNQPLGRMVGNAVEVQESIASLQNTGPDDLRAVTLALGSELMMLCGAAENDTDARAGFEAALSSGRALEKFHEMVVAQGGDPLARLNIAPVSDITATAAGFVTSIDAEALGRAVIALGGGRTKVGEKIDPSVGLEMLVRLGDRIERGQPLLRMFAHDRGAELAKTLVSGSIAISPEPSKVPQLIAGRVESARYGN